MQKPESLSEAMKLKNGPIAKFYMVKYAPNSVNKVDLSKLGCDEIREILT